MFSSFGNKGLRINPVTSLTCLDIGREEDRLDVGSTCPKSKTFRRKGDMNCELSAVGNHLSSATMEAFFFQSCNLKHPLTG